MWITYYHLSDSPCRSTKPVSHSVSLFVISLSEQLLRGVCFSKCRVIHIHLWVIHHLSTTYPPSYPPPFFGRWGYYEFFDRSKACFRSRIHISRILELRKMYAGWNTGLTLRPFLLMIFFRASVIRISFSSRITFVAQLPREQITFGCIISSSRFKISFVQGLISPLFGSRLFGGLHLTTFVM